MFGKSPLGGSVLVLMTSCLGAFATACLDRPLCADDCHPETTNQFVMSVPTGGINKIDLLFMIDNSRSMADKQILLSAAVPSLMSRFVTPLCLDDKGAPNGTHVTDGRCAAGVPEFPPIDDIHIGVISSSLGVPGQNVNCNRDIESQDDHAWLIPKVRRSAGLSSWNGAGFLAWDPTGTKNDPPGTKSQADLQRDFQDQVAKTGEAGCGFEASLESWYRFLADPSPPKSTAVQGGVVVGVDRDDELLKQRDDFLRSDSLVVVLMLTDENDCSLSLGSSSFLVDRAPDGANPTTMPRATAVCESNPHDPCCRSCSTGETSPPNGCQALAQDASCMKGKFYSGTEDPSNLRCWDQKRRYGIDLLEPTDKYVRALTQVQIPDREGKMQPNPLFSPRKGKPARALDKVFLAGIVGVPWQDIATDESRTGTGLRYLTARQLREQNRWDMILGDPAKLKLPSDPHMIETFKPRTGGNTLVTNGGTIAPAESNSPTIDIINGHEHKSTTELQYACIFELDTPDSTSDDCKTNSSSPLCQPPGGGAPGTTQYYAKAYPGLRHLEVLKGIEDQAIVASICPKVPRSPNPSDDPNYGYNPAVASVVDTLRPQLANKCLARAPIVEDGHTSCRVVETSFANDCNCAAPGRVVPEEGTLDSVRASMKSNGECDNPEIEGSPVCKTLCGCEIGEAQGDALTACRSTTDANAQKPAYCYVDPEKGLGDAGLVKDCPATQKRLLRFVGPETPRAGSLTFMACQGSNAAPR